MATMMAQAKELGTQRFVVTAGQIVAIVVAVVFTGGGSVWWLSSQWENVTLRLDQTEAAAKAAGEAARDVRERLTELASDAANDRRILLRLEDKFDALNITRFGGSLPPQ